MIIYFPEDPFKDDSGFNGVDGQIWPEYTEEDEDDDGSAGVTGVVYGSTTDTRS